MLSDCNVRPEIAVKELAAAKAFYEGTLGLRLLEENDEEMSFANGNGQLGVYRSQYAGTNKATYATWVCDDGGKYGRKLEGQRCQFCSIMICQA